jgi:hypothetical protein
MEWASWSDFWHMAGYGLYVWGSYGVTALVHLDRSHTFETRRHGYSPPPEAHAAVGRAMKSRHKKLLVIVLGVTGLGIAAALILNAFQSNLVFFFSPTQVERGEAPTDRAFRIGGLVESGSVKREPTA